MNCVALADVKTASGSVQAWVESAEPACGGYILTGPEVTTFTTNSVFTLSLADGALVGAAVAGVWCAAWAMRSVRSVLKGD